MTTQQEALSQVISAQLFRASTKDINDGGFVTILPCNLSGIHKGRLIDLGIMSAVSVPPKYAVSKIMGFLKGKAAINVFQRYPQIGKKYWGRHLWSRGYCVSTVGLDEERIRKYVKWQEKKEKQLEAIQGRLFD